MAPGVRQGGFPIGLKRSEASEKREREWNIIATTEKRTIKTQESRLPFLSFSVLLVSSLSLLVITPVPERSEQTDRRSLQF